MCDQPVWSTVRSDKRLILLFHNSCGESPTDDTYTPLSEQYFLCNTEQRKNGSPQDQPQSKQGRAGMPAGVA
jgi:hypothetical protein